MSSSPQTDPAVPATSIRSAGRNWLSVLASDIVTRASTFVLYVLVGRKLGAFEFGQMSIALGFFYVFQILASAGLKTLLTREVARDLARTPTYVANAQLVALAFSTLSVLVVLALVQLLDYSSGTSSIVVLVCVGLVPFSLSAVYEGILQGQERMGLIPRATVPASLLRVAVAFVLLEVGAGLHSVVLVLFASYGATALLEWRYVRRGLGSSPARPNTTFARRLARSSAPFLGIDLLVALTSTAATLLLSKLATEREVGLYAAASQLIVPVALVMRSATTSVFPRMSRSFTGDRGGFERSTDLLVVVVLTIAMPAAVTLAFLAGPVLRILYSGDSFARGAVVLEILAWQLVAGALTSVFGQVLFAALRERVNLRIVAIDAICMAVVGPALISRFGLTGAAVATTLVTVVDLVQHAIPAVRLLPRFSLLRLLRVPVLASMAVAAALTATEANPLAWRVVVTALAYAAVLSILALRVGGGVRGLRTQYASMRAR